MEFWEEEEEGEFKVFGVKEMQAKSCIVLKLSSSSFTT